MQEKIARVLRRAALCSLRIGMKSCLGVFRRTDAAKEGCRDFRF